MPKSKAQNSLEKCETLASLNAQPFIQEFHDAAIGSVSMMAGAFTGLAKALQAQNDRSNGLEERLAETNDTLRLAQESMKETETLVKDLAQQIKEQIDNINARFEEHGREFDEKLSNLDGELRDTIQQESKRVMSQMQKECKKMIAKISNQIKNTENQIKNLTKSCQDNRDKIQFNRGSIDQVRNETKQLKTDMKNDMKELNDYVEKSTTEMKDLVEHTADKLTKGFNDMNEELQNYKFQTNQALDHKANIDDLKRKMDVSEFKEFHQNLKEYQEKQEGENDRMEEAIKAEGDERTKFQETCDSNFGTANTDRRQLREDLDYVKKRVCDVPDPTEMIQRTHQELIDYINQVEACLREEMKARMQASSSSGPVFGNADGTCFSCGRSPSTSAFPPMPARSPKNSSGGGFKSAVTPTKGRSSRAFSSTGQLVRKTSSPKPMNKSMSLPELPGQEQPAEKKQVPSNADRVKLPAVEDAEQA